MSQLRFDIEWNSYEDSLVEMGETTARLGFYLDNHCLTRNVDIWSKTTRDHIHVSLYPLAMWFASSWWRLNHEVLPANAKKVPSHDWRMSHEMAAANMGFVWPKVLFSADGDSIQVWAQASEGSREESVRFLNGLSHVCAIPREQFAHEVSSLVENVLARLHEVGCKQSDLSELWSFINADLKDPIAYRKRCVEAELGFDPESCPTDLIDEAISVQDRIGFSSFSELTGAYAENEESRLSAMKALIDSEGIIGKPDSILDFSIEDQDREPWQVAVAAARELRQKLGNAECQLESSALCDLLGLSVSALEKWSPSHRARASVAGVDSGSKMKFLPRKTHPTSQRFELARFVGDYARLNKCAPNSWIVSADLSTSRQKFQRAFAAEFLCPINSLVDYLDGDFSETALEDASNHFDVSEKTVDALLMNNGYLPSNAQVSGMPYNLAE